MESDFHMKCKIRRKRMRIQNLKPKRANKELIASHMIVHEFQTVILMQHLEICLPTTEKLCNLKF